MVIGQSTSGYKVLCFAVPAMNRWVTSRDLHLRLHVPFDGEDEGNGIGSWTPHLFPPCYGSGFGSHLIPLIETQEGQIYHRQTGLCTTGLVLFLLKSALAPPPPKRAVFVWFPFNTVQRAPSKRTDPIDLLRTAVFISQSCVLRPSRIEHRPGQFRHPRGS